MILVEEEVFIAIHGGFFNVRYRGTGGILHVRGVGVVHESHARRKGCLGNRRAGIGVGIEAPGETENTRKEDKGTKGDLAV